MAHQPSSDHASPIAPCIWLDDQGEQAAAFYTKTFPRGRILAKSLYPETSDNPSRRPRGSVLTVEFEIAGRRFTALNGGPIFKANPSISFFVNVGTPAEADRLYAALIEGGNALMPIGTYPWSERYGWVQDRFGVSWQVMTTPAGDTASIAPCLMFSGPSRGRAEEAMKAYVEIFPRSRIEATERYAAGEGPEGTVKHGRFVLDGQTMVVMDSHVSNDVTFNEGLSLQVSCADQREVDRYWDALGKGGSHGACGWLKDRFGVSWQVVPKSISTWLTTPDRAARDRAFQAMMAMKKPDVAALERAFTG
jgi:predicted 3-demethylubiquinone-9 3-methyltransferase (glyoxalase superfamily)